MTAAQLVRQTSGGLADDLEVVDYLHLQQLVSVEGLATLGCVLLNPVDCLENVLKALDVPPQSGTASLSTRSRTGGRRPCSTATSTLQPRIRSSSIISAA